MSLRIELEAAGLVVRTVTGWGTRGGSWAVSKPVGVMEHHTALPVPFPVDRLYGDLLKCNINVKPDGTVWLIAAKACNFSSGSGSSIVLGEVRAGTPPTRNAQDRNLADNTNGNPWFFNFENDHAGTGGPIPQVQHDAIVRATQVVLDHYGLGPGNVISHAEWTARKRDPFWNGDRRCIETIRDQLEDDMPITDAEIEKIATRSAQKTWQENLGSTSALRQVTSIRAAVDALTKGEFRTITDEDLDSIANAVADEQARRLVE